MPLPRPSPRWLRHWWKKHTGARKTVRTDERTRRPSALLIEQLEDRLVPATTFSISNSSAIEPAPGGTVDMDFTVTRTGDLSSLVTVGYTTLAGTARPNTDFTPTTGTTTFTPGAATATIAIPVFGNGVYDHPDLTFSVQLTGIIDVVGPPVTFGPQTAFTTGTQPVSVVVGDVNGDGKPDIVTADVSDDTVSVLLNTTAPGAATPSFAAQQTFAVGRFPESVALGDINGDGLPDIITADSGTVSVLLNTTARGAATASFAAQQTFAVGGGPVSVAVGDVNGDGKPDIVVANQNSDTVSVLLNTTATGATTPSFAAQQTFATGHNPYSVAVGDLNGDGKPDIVVANSGTLFPGGASNTVSVLVNTTAPGATAPSFAAQQTFTVGDRPFSVALGDFNGDGKLDLVTANYGSGDNDVSVLLNTTAPGAATISFAPQTTFATGPYPQSVAVGDVTGDGRSDIVVFTNGYSNSVSVLVNTTPRGATTASFTAPQAFDGGIGPGVVTLGDLNGDGKLDIISALSFHSAVSVLLNTTVVSYFGPQQTFERTQNAPSSVVIGDVNGDGKPDLVIANETGISVFLNTTAPGSPTVSFAAEQTFPTGTNPNFVVLGDLNGDGKPDLVFVDGNGVSVLLNTTPPSGTTPSFAAEQSFAAGSYPHSVAVGDVNGDGEPDLIVANDGSKTVSVLLNTTPPGATTASFTAQQTFAAGNNPYSVAVGDINGDGRPDLIVANFSDNSVSVLLNTTPSGATTASFTAQQTFATGGLPVKAAVGDINGDGRPDLIVSNSGGGVSVLLNTTAPGATTASFTAQTSFPLGQLIPNLDLALGDINGDGRLDIVTANENSKTLSLLLNTTTAGASTPSFTVEGIPVTTSPFFLALGDLNGDGRPDLVIATPRLLSPVGGPPPDNPSFAVLINSPVVATDSLTITTGAATGTITESDPPPVTVLPPVTVPSPGGDVVIKGTSGDDTLLIVRTPGGGVGAITYTLNNNPPVELSRVTSLTFQGLDGNDTVTVSDANGGPLVSGGIRFEGGSGLNTLVADAAGAATRTVPGAVSFADGQAITYVNVSTIDINNAAAVNAVAGPDTADRVGAFAGLTAQERLVQTLYLDDLGRAGSRAELDGWLVQLAGTGGPEGVADAITRSAEGRDHLVRGWYLAYLGRSAQGGEEAGFVSALLGGAAEFDVLGQILASAEFYARAQTLTSSGSADERFVQALYLVLLDRGGEESTVQATTRAMPSVGRASVARAVLTSAEFRTDQIEGYYAALLHRPSDGTGLNGWLSAGTDLATILISFQSSSEFATNG